MNSIDQRKGRKVIVAPRYRVLKAFQCTELFWNHICFSSSDFKLQSNDTISLLIWIHHVESVLILIRMLHQKSANLGLL